MEHFQELLLTIFFAFFASLILSKLLSIASRETVDVSKSSQGGMGALRREIESESVIHGVHGDVQKVDKFTGERSIAADVDEEDEAAGVCEDENVEDVGGDADSFESSGAISENIEKNWADDVAVKSCEKVKLDELDHVDEAAGVCDEKVAESFMAEDEIIEDVGGDGDSFQVSGAIGENIENFGVDDVAVEQGCKGVRLDESDDVDEENAVDYEEKIVEHLSVDDAIVKDVVVDCDSFESSGIIGENIEKFGDEGDIRVNSGSDDQVAGVCEEKFVEHLTVGDEIVEDVQGVGVSFECSGFIGENIENIVEEGDIRLDLGSSDPVVDDEEAVEERNEGRKIGEFVEQVQTDGDIYENSGANDENVESIGVVDDIMVNLGINDPVVNEVAVEEKSEGRTLEEFEEKIVEHIRGGTVNFKNSGTNIEIFENVGVGGDIKLRSCDDVDEDDDWEGIERSELEEDFAAASNYVFNSDKNVFEPKLESIKMELYGLNKVALEGPCREPQPMAIMVSARAKWNAWQRLGNMSPDVAMEQYISLLSDKAPQWMDRINSGDGIKGSLRVSEVSPSDVGTYPKDLLNPTKERVFELNSATDVAGLTGGSVSVNKI